MIQEITNWVPQEVLKALSLYGKPLLEIIFISFVLYMLLLIIRGTRTAQVVKGLIVIILVFAVVRYLELDAINWLFSKIFAFSILAFIIIFQNDLRKALAQLGENRLFGRAFRSKKWVEEIVKAMASLSKRKIGALVVIERNIGLKNYIETGVSLDAVVSRELLITIFMENTPMHDGAVIVREERVASALCILPLSQSPYLAKTVGTRHRAAIGITEETDAVSVVVSEETGGVSFVGKGKITRELDEKALREALHKEIF